MKIQIKKVERKNIKCRYDGCQYNSYSNRIPRGEICLRIHMAQFGTFMLCEEHMGAFLFELESQLKQAGLYNKYLMKSVLE